MIHRNLIPKIQQMATKFPFVTITGPRQSGKSTIAKMAFPDYRNVSLEDLDMRMFAKEDPRGFINTFNEKVIIDEVQRVPSLLSYLQTYSDNKDVEGLYILTGSQNDLLLKAIDQSLAGRTSLNCLLPLSIRELKESDLNPKSIDDQIFRGGYPRLYAKDISPTDYYPSYINTYVERDIRQILNVGNLDKFVKFIRLCSGRIGQLLNKSSIATEVGVSLPTIESWLSVLQSSYIIYLLQPYYENFSKRLVKTPKLYFYDTGLACSLLGLNGYQQLETHYLRGALFENLEINEIMKEYLNEGIKPSLYFWRDSAGNEIDLVDTTQSDINLYEIKSGQTISQSFYKGLNYWPATIGNVPVSKNLIYAGDLRLSKSDVNVIPWKDLCNFKVRL